MPSLLGCVLLQQHPLGSGGTSPSKETRGLRSPRNNPPPPAALKLFEGICFHFQGQNDGGSRGAGKTAGAAEAIPHPLDQIRVCASVMGTYVWGCPTANPSPQTPHRDTELGVWGVSGQAELQEEPPRPPQPQLVSLQAPIHSPTPLPTTPLTSRGWETQPRCLQPPPIAQHNPGCLGSDGSSACREN